MIFSIKNTTGVIYFETTSDGINGKKNSLSYAYSCLSGPLSAVLSVFCNGMAGFEYRKAFFVLDYHINQSIIVCKVILELRGFN